MLGNIITDHHLVGKSYGGTRSRDNILQIKHSKHSAFHTIFENRTFVGQILKLKEMNATSLSPRIKSDIIDLLNMYRGEDELFAYKNGVLIPDRFLQAQEKFKR